jgi:hypothetical protein
MAEYVLFMLAETREVDQEVIDTSTHTTIDTVDQEVIILMDGLMHSL